MVAWASPITKEDEAKKKDFAEALLRFPLEPFKAAQFVFAGALETGKAAYVSQFWPLDPEVKEFQNALLEEHGEEYFLPNKASLAAELWHFFKDEKQQGKDRVAAAKTYAEVMGWTTKAGAPGSGSSEPVQELPPTPTYKIVDK